jgi:hypothetical protein
MTPIALGGCCPSAATKLIVCYSSFQQSSLLEMERKHCFGRRDGWINGVSPMELAPHLYMQAHYKHRSVQVEMKKLNWIKNLRQVNIEELMDEFVLLFSTLNEVQLTDDNDSILWKWSAAGEYSAALAYEIQFLGAYPRFRASSVW